MNEGCAKASTREYNLNLQHDALKSTGAVGLLCSIKKACGELTKALAESAVPVSRAQRTPGKGVGTFGSVSPVRRDNASGGAGEAVGPHHMLAHLPSHLRHHGFRASVFHS